MMMKFVLNAKNKITATGASAVRVLRYSFVITNWRLENNDKKSTELLQMCTLRHLGADSDKP
jgi:hypothetical protein